MIPLVQVAVFAAVEGAPAGSGIDLSPIVNVGAFGVLSLLLIWFAKGAYQREVKRADTAEAALQALQVKVIDMYVPATVEATRVIGQFLDEARRDRR